MNTNTNEYKKLLIDNKKLPLIDPNFLIDIFIRFIIIASIFYILYKYYLVDTTINNFYKILENKLNLYIPSFKNVTKAYPTIFNQINDIITEYINYTNTLPSTQNSKNNDTNMMIIFITMVLVLFLIISIIIYITNGIKFIDYKNVFYSIIFNILFITLSQFTLFYVIYEYIDPIKIYNLFYYNYKIDPTQSPIDTNLSTLSNAQLQLNQLIKQYNTLEIPLSNSYVNTPEPLILSSTTTSTVFIFMIIFLCIFIIMLILSIVNYIVIYNGYNISSNILPFTNISFAIYIMITCVSFIAFIILLLMILNSF